MSFIKNLYYNLFTNKQTEIIKEIITMKITELTEIVNSSVATLAKAHGEIVSKLEELNQKITSLEEVIASTEEVPAELVSAVEAVRIAAQSLDDVVPDAVVLPEEPVE